MVGTIAACVLGNGPAVSIGVKSALGEYSFNEVVVISSVGCAVGGWL
ncbi:hypothetical protein [Mycobacterium paragordonae]|nr:hypothetical protein [Mycobacterium paragordonae]